MVGGSPSQSRYSVSHSDTESDDSYDYDEYRRNNYEDRRSKRREMYGSRDHDNKKKRRKSQDDNKEICRKFAEFGTCPDVSYF